MEDVHQFGLTLDRGTLINACCSIPFANPCSEMMKHYLEWCIAPIGFH
jgi:hypothetical protein